MADEPLTTPATPETPTAPITPEKQPTPDSNAEGYYKRQLEKAQKELDGYKKADEDARKAAMTEAERLKAEKDAADLKAADAVTKANQRIIRAEAKVQASAAGIKAERLDYALRMLDLTDVEIGEDGEPDSKSLAGKIGKLLNGMPELGGSTQAASGGPGPGGGFGGSTHSPGDVQAQINEALKAGNLAESIRLKTELYDAQRRAAG